MKPYKAVSFAFVLFVQLIANSNSSAQYTEKSRPQFHFSPVKGWIGDPDGLIHFKGLYHLFWWGHAVSRDLVHWRQVPVRMRDDDSVEAYNTGSAVVDKSNTAGFGNSSIVAVYTIEIRKTHRQMVGLSYSADGIHFTPYTGNPVLDVGSNDFRDPCVFWSRARKHWVMAIALAAKHQIGFYSSSDLKSWKYLSSFGPLGAYEEVWETPDLFELPVQGNGGDHKWVLTVGQGPNRMQYFLGDFNGISFTPDSQTVKLDKKPLWIDYGTDFYASRTWREEDFKDSKRTVIQGWMGNWKYAREVPSSWGKGFEAVPRLLSLKHYREGIRLVQQPIPELETLRRDSFVVGKRPISYVQEIKEISGCGNTYELEAAFQFDENSEFGLNLLIGEGRKLTIGYDTKTKQLYIDRIHCSDFVSDSTFNHYFPTRMFALLVVKNSLLKLHVLVDKSSVEVFADDGHAVLSCVTYPSQSQTGATVFAEGGKVTLLGMKIWQLASIWSKLVVAK